MTCELTQKYIAARGELRQWFKKGLIVERGGLLFATDALQRASRSIVPIG